MCFSRFLAYEDEGLFLSADHVPYCREDFSNWSVPMWVPDPPDPTKIPMYNKKEVFLSVTVINISHYIVIIAAFVLFLF